MKKYLSVFMLFVRSSFCPLFFGTLGWIGVQGAVFCFFGMDEGNLYQALQQVPFDKMSYVYLIALAGTLASEFCDRGGRMNNTMQRLSISEKDVFAMQAVYNSLIFAMYFLMMGLAFVGFSFLYDPRGFSNPEVLVTAYRHPIFHTFFPLENFWGAISNVILFIGLGICTAAFPIRQRHGMRSFTTAFMTFLGAAYLYLQNEGAHFGYSGPLLVILGTVVCVISSLSGVAGLEVDDYE